MRVTPMTLGLIAALITVPFAVAPAHATNWQNVSVDMDNAGRWAYDTDTLDYTGQTATFIGRYELNTGRWSLAVMQVRCTDAMFRASYTDTYIGRQLVRRYNEVGNWTYIAKGTVAEFYFKNVCVTS